MKIAIMVKRSGTKAPRVPTRRRMTKRNPRDKDVYLTLTKDVKFFCLAGFNENIICLCL